MLLTFNLAKLSGSLELNFTEVQTEIFPSFYLHTSASLLLSTYERVQIPIYYKQVRYLSKRLL